MDAQAKQSNFLINSQRQAQKQDTTATNEAGAEEVQTKQNWVSTQPLPKNERDTLLREQQDVKEAILKSKTNASPPDENCT